jgi:hypothetical protein
MDNDFAAIFERIRALFERHAPQCVTLCDEPGRYYLGSHEVRAKDGYRTAFGGVEVKKNYVSAHVMPVYVHPELLDGVSADLRGRMQGKQCFNFRKLDERLIAELGALVDRGAERFAADGRLTPPAPPD